MDLRLRVALFFTLMMLPVSTLAQSSNKCESRSREDWIKFLDSYANNKKQYSTDDYPEVGATEELLNACSSQIKDLGLGGCFQNTLNLASERARIYGMHWDVMPDGNKMGSTTGYKFDMPDADYIASQPKLAEPPDAILKAARDPKLLRQFSQQSGTKMIEFDSQFSGVKRYVFRQHEGNLERFMLAMPESSTVDVIVVDHQKTGNKIYFREYLPPVADAPLKLSMSPQPCFNCHLTGPRDILPKPGTKTATTRLPTDPNSISDDLLGEERLSEFQKAILSNSAPNWSGLLHPEHFGPPLGSDPRFGCINCHDGKRRGEINSFTRVDEIRRKIIDEGSMPPGIARQMTKEQRTQFADSLLAVYQDELKQWLLSPSCDLKGATIVPCPQAPSEVQQDTNALVSRITPVLKVVRTFPAPSSKLKPILKNCSSCHADPEDAHFIPFDNPEKLSDLLQSKPQLIDEISRRLNSSNPAEKMPFGGRLPDGVTPSDLVGYFKKLL